MGLEEDEILASQVCIYFLQVILYLWLVILFYNNRESKNNVWSLKE